ncbi:SRPBCC family protein [Haladaptatus pallidirubidus]|uniref:Polyketide cyclase / dehydrase and lipid transport n=1 Tax=Haladaptatus pallidirubidus TaxID=1008152 RepID=A0AAV3UIW2_9EURY|nr:SRPBCC domain-containing protein [Haladaptatus pallidirubidus]
MTYTKTIRTEIEIDASPATVWKILTNLDSYQEWNPHITEASGDLKEQATIEIHVQGTESSSRMVTMTVTVTDIEPRRTLRWVGSLYFSWIFEGRHTFHLEPLDDDCTRFINHERRSGILAPLVTDDNSWRAYEEMNRALAERAEKHASTDHDSTP